MVRRPLKNNSPPNLDRRRHRPWLPGARGLAAGSLAVLIRVGAVSAQQDMPSAVAQSAGTPPPAAAAESDPLESLNRKIFWLNDNLDVYVLEPVAKGWDYVLPKRVEVSISNFFYNLRFPIETLNCLLQGKFERAGSDVARFLINTTVGVAGFFDPATGWGFPLHWEDFGQTLGWWGLGPGPYLVLPILGPSDLRDGAGLIVDSASSVTPFFIDTYILLGARTVEIVNVRAQYLDTVRQAKESAFDYYGFVRNAYLQRRAGLINDQGPEAAKPAEDLYYPEGVEPAEDSYHPEGEKPADHPEEAKPADDLYHPEGE
ncbi:MAG: MlaA family lipoprotein [Candidatus Binatia bacterium]